jgi:hypothetical protein
MPNLTVSCPCGETSLRINADPINAFYCHCDDDQVVHGAPMVGVTLFPEDAVEAIGKPVIWKLRVTPRTICGACGARMMINPGLAPVVGVVATLLPTELFEPTWHQQCSQSTLRPADELPKYVGYPKAMGGTDDAVDW